MKTRYFAVCGGAFLAAAMAVGQERGELFDRLDANKDGYVTDDEVQGSQKSLFERQVRVSDKDGDKKLSREEFNAGLRAMGRPENPGERGDGAAPRRPGGPPDPAFFSELFDRTDANSDGKLTKDEVPEGRQGMRMLLERGGDSLTKEQFLRGMQAMLQGGEQPRGEGAPPRDGDRSARPGDGPPRGPGMRGMPPPGGGLFAALDTDRDGQLSNQEIVGAGLALLRLDRNQDGRITPEEAFGPPGPPEGRQGDRRPGDGRPPFGRPGEGRVGEGRPGEGRPNEGRGGFGPEAFLARMKEADSNNDNKLSKDEAPPMLRDRFDQADRNSDGFLDETELREMAQRMRGGPGGPGGRRGGDRPGGDRGPRSDGGRPDGERRPDSGDKK